MAHLAADNILAQMAQPVACRSDALARPLLPGGGGVPYITIHHGQ